PPASRRPGARLVPALARRPSGQALRSHPGPECLTSRHAGGSTHWNDWLLLSRVGRQSVSRGAHALADARVLLVAALRRGACASDVARPRSPRLVGRGASLRIPVRLPVSWARGLPPP